MGTKAPSTIRTHKYASRWGSFLTWGLLALLICLLSGAAPAQNDDISQSPSTRGQRGMGGLTDDPRTDTGGVPPVFGSKQKENILIANFKRSKSDAAELAALAKELRAELDKPATSQLSADVIDRVQKIERLARKIRDETRGY